jgi:glycosyltransferase involved in cell wall biosynthesis
MEAHSIIIDKTTPLIITYNEASNIRRTLNKLLWARRIVVVDSGSSDETIGILREYPQVQVLHRVFTDFASQCNFGLTQITTPWVLSLDADYELSEMFVSELQSLAPREETSGYRANFVYRIYGRPLRGSLYPPRVVLYRRDRAIYRNEGHGHKVSINGPIQLLAAPIFHDDRKPLSYWFASQYQYARHEAQHLVTSDRAALSSVDRLRLLAWPAPLAVAIYTLFVKGCFFDGWAGWFYVLERLIWEILVAVEILDKRLRQH